MKKYAIVEEIVNKKRSWLYAPWIKKGAVTFKSFQDVPDDFIILADYPPWLEPLKTWAENGGKFIEFEWGYWGEKVLKGNKARIQMYRVTYCHSHNINMRAVPFSRFHTLNPSPEEWKINRGDTLLLIEPNHEFVTMRTGLPFEEWKELFLLKITPYWDGPMRWRHKRGGGKANRFKSYKRDLETSFAVVGERTMACVEAVMLGYPAYTVDMSAVTPLMGNDLTVLKNPILPDRTQWFEHIAWSQFHKSEFEDGTSVADMVEMYQIDG